MRALSLLVVLPIVAACLACPACHRGPQPRPPPPPEFFKRPEIPPSDPASIQLRGRVLDPNGKPLADVPVLVIAGGHQGERPRTNAAGEFSVIGLPPTNDGFVAVHVPGYAVQVREPVRVSGRSPESVTMRLERESVLEGRVVDADEHPLANAKVTIRGERRLRTPLRKDATWEEVVQRDTLRTDADGRFRFDGLYAGRFEVSASMPGASGLVAKSLARSGAAPVVVRIDPRELHQVLFTGRVVDAATKAPIVGAEVWVRDVDAKDGEVSSSDTSADGTFVVGPFTPSLFSLRVRAQGYVEWKQSGAREEGSARVEVELEHVRR